MLPIIVQHGVVERVDALEIFGVERVLRADPLAGLRAEIGLQQLQHRTEDRQAGQAELAAFLLQPLGEVVIEQGIEHDAGRFLDLGQHAIELFLGPHQRIDMLDRRHLGVLRRRRASDRDQSLTGRIRDEMQMEIAAGSMGHGTGKACGSGEKAMPWG